MKIYRDEQVGSSSDSDAEWRNVIAGNGADVLSGANSVGNYVTGNLIGTDKSGTNKLSPGTCVEEHGTSGEFSRNVIAGCGTGVMIKGAQYVSVHDNAIGIGVDGVALGNSSYGMSIENASGYTTGANIIYSNGIANNFSDGIIVLTNSYGSPKGNNLNSNSIFNNGSLGINLAPDLSDGVTINDNLDADSGPNNLQNYPVITSATLNSSGAVVMTFTLDSLSSTQFSVRAFSNDSCNPSGHGEGRYGAPYNSTTVNTDGSGHASGTITLAAPLSTGWGLGKWVALLTHDVFANNTSEFSTCMQVKTPAGCPEWPAKETGYGPAI